MIKATHIATKLILLIAITLLFALTRYASAQVNTSAAPYIGSTHLYRVAMGDFNNNVTWQLSNTSPTTIGTPQAWIAFGKKDLATDSAWIEITFVSSVFDNGYTGLWTLTYNETSTSTGNCVAVRTMDITPVPNLFNLVMAATATDCNSYHDTIFDNADGDISTITGNSSVPFTVTMNKDNNFRLKQWSFTGTISSVSGCTLPAIIPSVVVTPSGAPAHGTLAFAGTGVSFTATVSGINTTDDFTTDVITFNIVVNGSPTIDYELTLDIVGTAVSGTNYNVSTGENSATDNKQVNTIYGIPNTSLVSVTP